MLVACRLAGLSALILDYDRAGGRTQQNPMPVRVERQRRQDVAAVRIAVARSVRRSASKREVRRRPACIWRSLASWASAAFRADAITAMAINMIVGDQLGNRIVAAEAILALAIKVALGPPPLRAFGVAADNAGQ